ncbi:MAG: hybrid sensor histidine kinase/response regulator, partial [Spirochaetaceae bacterium]
LVSLIGRGNAGHKDILDSIENIHNIATGKLIQQRRKTELNIHKTMTGYIKAVQRSLMGETIYFNTRPTHLMSMVNRVKQKYREILEDKSGGINIAFDTVVHTPDVYIGVLDFALINILENLLTNSIRKVHESKKKEQWIHLSTGEETIDGEDYTVCRWEDNGTGVIPGRKQSIFDGDSDKTEEGDHGIGLRDIKNTVESSGGFIREEGVAGEGALFIIGFPKVTKVEEIDYDEDLEEEVLCFPAVYKQKKIFVVDDDMQILSLFKGFLQKAGIQDVTAFTRVDDALAAVKKASPCPDMVITDLEMEPLNGLAFVKKLKDSGISVPVLVVSGILFHGTPTDYSLLRELNMLGVRDIVRKPVDFIELFDKMQRILA